MSVQKPDIGELKVTRIMDSLGTCPIKSGAYPTAFAINLKDSDGTVLFPDSINWILNNQHPDGSWGDSRFWAPDRLVCTLAAIVNLHDSSHPESKQAMSRGIQFLSMAEPVLTDSLRSSQWPIAFELIVPYLMNKARDLGVAEIPGIASLRFHGDRKLSMISRTMLTTMPTTLLYSIEAIDIPSDDIPRLVKFLSANGGLADSPAATAKIFENTGSNLALKYLADCTKSTGDGGFSETFPADVYESVWVADALTAGRLGQYCRTLVDSIASRATPEGVNYSTSFPIPDADNTSVAAFVLQQHGRSTEAEMLVQSLKKYERDYGFVCYKFENDPSSTVNSHVLRALCTARSRHGFDEQIKKAKNFVLSARQDGYYWEHDKWNVSACYATMCAVQSLSYISPQEAKKSIDWILDQKYESTEEAAYIAYSLDCIYRSGFPVPEIEFQKLYHFMAGNTQESHPGLWISKGLYCPQLIVESEIVGATNLCLARIK
ncbi:hypothetical protein [Nocardia brasiliensis]|uniref:hypothetical protein n=1 Tax=Nocardia brasiliensis TaxID=37326 RepID=UPI00245389BE|nr:hypothetical protein [Nocardia brasiliensis]